MKKSTRLEVLYSADCPSHARLRPILQELAAAHDVVLEERPVETIGDAERERFLGSPTVRVDGVDVEPGAQSRSDFGLKCRLYRLPQGSSGLPARAWIERALRA